MIVKTRTYEGDRVDENADRFAMGVYWIGGRISLVSKCSEISGSEHLDQDIYIELKDNIQGQLFPIITDLLSRPANRNDQILTDRWFFTAFNKLIPIRDNQNLLYHKLQKGFLKKWPTGIIAYKGRSYIFFGNTIWGSALYKSSTNFAMGDDYDLGFCVSWGDGKIGDIKWVFSGSKLIIGTSSGIYYSDSIIEISANGQYLFSLPEMLTNIVPNKTLPVLISQSIVFVGADNTTIYEIQLAGENGISVSKINSHCLGIFSQDIIKLCSQGDYLYAIGIEGECNVCCFANQGFTRRWFSYSFGGNNTRLTDIFLFNSGKLIGSFRRRFTQITGEVATIEHMRPLFDIYKDKASEQFFLDCAVSKYSKSEIKTIENGKKFEYFFKDSVSGCSWEIFFKLISSLVTVKVIFCRCVEGDFSRISYFGGDDNNCIIWVNSEDLGKDENENPGINISPFIYENEEAFSDSSLLGQPYFSEEDRTDSSIVPFFDLDIWDYEFFFNQEEDVQYLRINLDRDIEINGKYLGLIFGIGEIFNGDLPFELEFINKNDGYLFTVNSVNGGVYYLDLKSDRVTKLYISPYTSEELDHSKNPITRTIGEIATLEFQTHSYLSENIPCIINDVYGAKGYNQNRYVLSSIGDYSSGEMYIYWKNKKLRCKEVYEIPENKYWEVSITAYCAENGNYVNYPQSGNVYFFMSYFEKENIEHLIGETCQIMYDGNQGWMDDNEERVTNFILMSEMFGPLIPPWDDDEGHHDGDPTPVLFLPKECVGIYIVIGLPYVSELQTVGLEGGSLFGTSEGTVGISREAGLTVLFSRGGMYGNTPDEARSGLYPLRYGADNPDNPKNVSKDLVSATFNTTLLTGKDNMVRSMYILHDIPCNFSVLNIVHDVKVSDG